MTKRRKVDASKVLEAVESGRLSRDVLDGYGLDKQSPRNNQHSVNKNDITGPLGDVTVSKRGSLVLPKSLVEKLGLRTSDSFIARKTKAGIILKPV
jgi:hypothetical protein